MKALDYLLIPTFCLLTSLLFSQGTNADPTVVTTQKQALLADYLGEGAGASHIFGFFFLDIDTDKDGNPDFFETAPGDDLDGDGLINMVDPDDDNDGILDGADVQPAGVTSMPAHLFRNGTVAEANGNSTTDYWQFVPNNLISGGPFDGYFEHPGAYLYVDNNANAVPDILEYVTGDNQIPPYAVDKGVATAHALLGAFQGLLGEWEYSGSPGASAAERMHLTGSTIFYICDDDGGLDETSQYHTYSPYGTSYSDIYGNSNGQVDYNIYGTGVANSTLIPQEVIGMDAQGIDYFRYRWFEHIVDANREIVYFASVFWNSGGSNVNTYFSKVAFNPDAASSGFSPAPNGNTSGDNFGNSGINNWFPRFQNTSDHNMLAAGAFGAGTTWAMIASAPTDGSSPVAVNPANQAWVDQYENWTTDTRILQYIDVSEWLSDFSNDVYALINGRYSVDLASEDADIIVRLDEGKLPHFLIYAPSDDPSSLVIGLEDLFGGGDRDYEDVAFYITGFEGTNVVAYKSDNYSAPQCQDTIQYRVVIRNSGNTTAEGVVFNDTPDANTALIVGSVSTTLGTVVSGNTAGNTSVQVDAGNLALGDSAVIYFTVDVVNGIYPGVNTVSNQGLVSGDNFSSINTSDPEAEFLLQPTVTDLADVLDLSAPMITCPTSFSESTDMGSCEAVVTYTAPTGTDDCPGAVTSLFSGPASGSTFSVGATTITYRVTDPNGNTADCSFTVTVNDNEAPSANCVTSFSLPLDATGNASLSANDIDSGSGDACGIDTRVLSPMSFGCGEVGSNTVTLTVTDNNSNSSTCTTTVTIQDNTPPTAQCQNVEVQLDAGGQGGIAPAQVNDGSSDACGGLGFSLDQSAFDCSDVGSPVTVTLTVTDANTNTSTCTAQVTVLDEVAPNAQCQNVEVQLDAGGSGGIAPAQVDYGSSDACGGLGFSLDQTAFDCSDVGSPVSVTLTVTDANTNTSTCTAQVTVLDEVAPNAQCQNVEVQLDAGGSGGIAPAQVDYGSSDACGGLGFSLDQSVFDCSDVGSPVTVTLTVTDGNSNTSTCTAQVTVLDEVAPDAQCQNVEVQLDAGGQGGIAPAQVNDGSSDACGGLGFSLDQSAFDCSDVGSPVTVTLTVTDGNSNTSTCTAQVTVLDEVAPDAQCQNVEVQLDAGGQGGIAPAQVNDGSGDACGGLGFSLDQTAFDCSDVGSPVTVTLTVTDGNSNMNTCTAQVTVLDEIAPDAQCQNVEVQLDAGGQGGIAPAQVNNSSSDACGIANTTIDQEAFDCSHIESVSVVTLTVEDNSGNTSTCTSSINVVDLIAPQVFCIEQTITFNGETEQTVSVDQFYDAINSTDNCGMVTLSGSTEDVVVSCEDVGAVIPISITAEDPSGNTNSCTANITVTGLPCGWKDDGGIGCEDDLNTSDYDATSGTFSLFANNCAPVFPYSEDAIAFVYTELCGNGEIIARVANIQGTGYAGVMMRASDTPNAPMVAMGTNTTNRLQRQARTLPGYPAWPQQILSYDKFWVRVVRTGDMFSAFASVDGSSWIPYLNQQVFMGNDCIIVGLYAYSEKANNAIEASFDNVSVMEAGASLAGLPGVSTLGEANTSVLEIDVYPNPTSSTLSIDLSHFMEQEVEFHLFNNLGQQVMVQSQKQANAPIAQLDVSQFPSGIYNLVIRLDNYRVVKRVILARE